MEEYTVRRKTSNSIAEQDYDFKPKSFSGKVLNIDSHRAANTEVKPEDFAENKIAIKKQDPNNILANILLFLIFLSSIALWANQIKLSNSSHQKMEALNRDTTSIKENLAEMNESIKQLKSELSFQREKQLKQELNYQKELLQKRKK